MRAQLPEYLAETLLSGAEGASDGSEELSTDEAEDIARMTTARRDWDDESGTNPFPCLGADW